MCLLRKLIKKSNYNYKDEAEEKGRGKGERKGERKGEEGERGGHIV